jgi:hypothetical protein
MVVNYILKIGAGGFGIGVFEIDGDDVDVYDASTAPERSSNYDIEITEAEETLKSKPKEVNHYIPGYLKTKRLLPNLKSWHVPLPPKDYICKPPFIVGKVVETPVDVKIEDYDQSKSGININLAPTISSMLSFKDHTQIHKAISKSQEITRPRKAIPIVPKDIALSALSGFMPFADDMKKRDRYIEYLRFMAEEIKELPLPPSHLTKEEIDHEPVEFSKAALIYRPLSKMMASRFTSSTIDDVISFL